MRRAARRQRLPRQGQREDGRGRQRGAGGFFACDALKVNPLFGMSRTALAMRSEALVGEAPIAYLTHWRITRAASLLRTERTSLDHVAEAVGYSSQPVFSKAFRRVTRHTPGRWRRGEGIAAGINIGS